MHHDHRHRAKPDCMLENLARVEECPVCSSARYNHGFTQQMPLGVKVERKSAFLGFVYSNRAHLTHYIVRGLHRVI